MRVPSGEMATSGYSPTSRNPTGSVAIVKRAGVLAGGFVRDIHATATPVTTVAVIAAATQGNARRQPDEREVVDSDSGTSGTSARSTLR